MAKHLNEFRYDPPLSREEVIELCRSGNRDGLVKAHLWLVDKLCRDMAREWEVNVEDLESEADLALLAAVDRLQRSSTNPTSYIWSVIKGRLTNYCEAEVNRRYRHTAICDTSEERDNDPEDEGGNAVRMLDDILGLCDAALAEIVELRRQGFSVGEIAKKISLSESTIYARLQTLAAKYDQQYGRPKKSDNFGGMSGEAA